MSFGNTNPDKANAPTSVVGYFSDLVLGDDAINTILDLVSPSVVESAIDDNSAVLVTERAGYSFLPLKLIIIATMDMTGITGLFSLESQTDSEDFNWDDYVAALDGVGKIVVIYLDGINSTLPASGSNITIAFPDPTLFTARFALQGIWIPD